jgi:hypothetical protein
MPSFALSPISRLPFTLLPFYPFTRFPFPVSPVPPFPYCLFIVPRQEGAPQMHLFLSE